MVFADNADGVNSTAMPVTDTNIFIAYSDDGGETWTGGDHGTDTDLADRIRVDGSPDSDQWFPWAAIGPGSFSYQMLSQVPSNPDQSIFFRAQVGGCENCATFIGDYNGLHIDSLGRIHGVWTDMRRPIVPGLNAQDAFYARR